MIPTRAFNVPRSALQSDDALADAIEADGRLLLGQGFAVSMERYLSAVHDLAVRAVPLDAAIDIALRSSAAANGNSRPTARDAELLASAYPAFREAIYVALNLDHGLLTTQQVQRPAQPVPLPGLPRDFGPMLPDGRERYTLTKLIGTGASGAVYAATDRHLSEPDRPAEVAIKVLATRPSDTWIARRLTEEATKARRVDHPSVVRVLDRGGEQTEAPYIVYELVKGGDLQTWFEQHSRTIPVRRAVEIVAQIARGVQAAHASGLVHSDLKPANVLLDVEGHAKVADFGIAARLHRSLLESRNGSGGDEPSGPVGNMAFIAPEQFRSEPGCFSVPSDVYALGGILYYLLAGCFPNGDTPALVAIKHGDASKADAVQPPSPKAVREEIDKTIDLICVRSLMPRPADRYASASAFADDLESWLQNKPVLWQRPAASTRVRLWVRRRPSVAVLSMIAALLFVGSIASTVYYIRRINEKNSKLIKQNEQLAEGARMVEEIIKKFGPNAPGVTDPRAKSTMEKLAKVKPVIDLGIQRIDDSEETVYETSPPPSPNPGRSNP